MIIRKEEDGQLLCSGVSVCAVKGCGTLTYRRVYCDRCEQEITALAEIFRLQEERRAARRADWERRSIALHAWLRKHEKAIDWITGIGVLGMYWYALWSVVWQLRFGGK